jgi:O-antigen ligase
MQVLLALCACKILLLIVTFDPSGLIAFDLPKSLVSRALMWPMAAILALLFLAHGRRVLPRSHLHLAVIGVAAAWLVAALSAQDQFLALFGEEDRYLGLTYLADMIVLYIACAVTVRDVRGAAIIFGAIAIGALIALGYAAVQAIGADPLWWQVPAERPFSTFGNPDHFGHFLSVLFGLSFGGVIASRGVLSALAGALGVLMSLAAASVVATRGTALGILGAIVAAPLVPATRARAAAAIAIVAVALALVFVATPLGDRVRATLAGEQMADRAVVYAVSLRAFAARPLAGYGPDNFRVAYAQHRPSSIQVPLAGTPQTSAHDWVFDAAVTTGALGLFALLMLVGLGSRELFVASRRAPNVGVPLLLGWSAYWAHALVAVGSIAIGWLPWAALGVAVGLDSPVAPNARRLPRWLWAVVLIASLVASTTGARAFLANRDALVMEDASATGDPRTALVAAERAVSRDPGRAENWNRLGLAQDGLELWRASLDAYREAAARRPYEPIYWANVARSSARLALAGDAGARDEAIAAARRGIEADPNSPIGHAVMVEIAVAFRLCDLARTEAGVMSSFGRADLAQLALDCR